MKRAPLFVILAAFLFSPVLSSVETGSAKLYREFRDPPREYTVRPFWFWNDKLDAREIQWQIEQMVSQGVYGAYVHNRGGLDTPYLSDDYFEAVRAGFEKARQLGFLLGFVDEYEWPSGEARDIWIQGLPSRVVAANAEFRMRSLFYQEKDVEGPARVEFSPVEQFQSALAMKLVDTNTLDPESIRDVSEGNTPQGLRWEAPAGRWRVMVFYLAQSQGRDGGLVDLMNAAAIRKFLDLTYEQYYKRFSEHFGRTIDSTYVDHEGDYGYRIAWTPQLFDTFRRLKGYDLRKSLPLLMYEAGKRTPKVRCDYLDVISELYYQSFFKQVADWCEAHGIKVSGHVWEENLEMEAAFEGDLPRIMRGWSWPGVDSLWDHGRLPRDFKATGSVAHFRGTRFTCENQGLHGSESFLDFQKMRLGTNMIAVWGVNSFTPHAFNYNRRRIEYPPDWFYHQPYWKYFKQYADYTRRLSYMNDGGRHVADVLVFQPTESAWAHSEPVFSTKSPYIPSKWNNPLDTINAYYTDIMNRLAQERWDFDVADSHYLLEAKLNSRTLAIGNEAFQVLVLPPTTTMRRDVLRKVREFYDQGGMVIGIKILPDASMEEGRGDPVLSEDVRYIFGESAPATSRSNANAAGGKAFFVKDDVAEILNLLGANLSQDVKVLDGDRSHLFYLHRKKEGVDFYWVVNDSADARDHTIRFSALGRPEQWDATDASKAPLFYRNMSDGTEARLHFDPWEGYYVVFVPLRDGGQTLRLVKTNLKEVTLASADKLEARLRGLAPLGSGTSFFAELQGTDGRRYTGNMEMPRLMAPIELNGRWMLQPEKRTLAAPYAMTKDDPRGEGMRLGWHRKEFDSSEWSRAWLSRERLTVKDWWVIGPFPNPDHRGFAEAYPPEKSVDLKASYPLPSEPAATPLRWTRWTSPSYVVDMDKALALSRGKNWVTSYAISYVYSPVTRRVQFRIAADNSAKLWVNGKNLLDLHIHPFYYELREDFAFTRMAELHSGWNEILIKLSKCGGSRQYGFMLRVTDDAGAGLDDLVFSPDKLDRSAAQARRQTTGAGQVWYRIPVPVSASGVKLPRLKGQATVFYNGEKRQVDPDSGIVRFPQAAEGKDNVLALFVSEDETIADVPEFQLGQALIELGSWLSNGLPYYSGSAAYERTFDLPQEYVGKKLILDCGAVGVVAEVWVNDKPAGVRVWLPFSFDISNLVRPGSNRLKIVVTNTMENERAVENRAGRLGHLELSGLLGPVKLIPYMEVALTCK